MPDRELVSEAKLASLAKRYRKQAKKTRAEAARDMGVSQTTIFNAEESPMQSLTKVRIRMIEAYSNLKIAGPLFLVEEK